MNHRGIALTQRRAIVRSSPMTHFAFAMSMTMLMPGPGGVVSVQAK
jgi:hypothetical protein